METVVKLKKWGSSMGVILPSDLVRTEKMRPGDELVLHIEKRRNILKELFGAFKFKKSTEQMLKESRELESKWL